MPDRSEAISIGYAECVAQAHSSDGALKMQTKEHGTFWIAFDHVHDDSEVWRVGDKGRLFVQLWYAELKGWT